jgi:hypothetical protein
MSDASRKEFNARCDAFILRAKIMCVFVVLGTIALITAAIIGK